MEVPCDNLHQGLVGTDQDQVYNAMLLIQAQPRDPIHMMGDQGLGPAHLHLRRDQALHLPLAGIQCLLQLHTVLVAPGHALGWQQGHEHPLARLGPATGVWGCWVPSQGG